MDPIRPGRERSSAEFRVVVLTDSENGPAGCVGERDRLDAVVGARGQVDDDPVDIGERALETGRRTDRDRDGIARPHQVSQAGGPDEVVGEDRDPGGQSSDSAR
jgi:hypothetical protein